MPCQDRNNSAFHTLAALYTPRMQKTEAYLALEAAARERILILDGAMGTMIQGLGLVEETSAVARYLGTAASSGQ